MLKLTGKHQKIGRWMNGSSSRDKRESIALPAHWFSNNYLPELSKNKFILC